jgi:MerR family transcriptional regulator, light-induced transcriptional regulator
MATTPELLRIGELSNRVGVSPELLRAWERRYGLLRPARSAGGLRLYSPADADRVALMQQHLAQGMAAAEAAGLAARDAADDEAARTAFRPEAIRSELAEALDAFDETRAQAILDRLLAVATVETLLSEVLVPYLQSSASDGSAARHRSPKNTLRPACCRTAARSRPRVGPRGRPRCGPGLPPG